MKKPIRLKILSLEEGPCLRGRLQEELEKSGLHFTLATALTWEDYEKALGSSKPDIILSGYPVPVFGEFSAFEIRQKAAPATPFMVISGRIGEENLLELIRMGVTDYVLEEKLSQLAPRILRALQEAAHLRKKRKALGQLRLREQHLHRIMDLSLDVICTLDQEGRFVTINAACKPVLGYSPEELTGRKAIDLVHQEDRERSIQGIAELMQGLDLINFENRYVRKDGGVITLLWSAHWDPVEKLRYCVARDATEIKKAQEKTKNSEKRFRALLQNSSHAFSLLAADGTVIERGPSSAKVLGYEKEGLPTKYRLDLVHPDDLPVIKEAFTQVRHYPDHKRTIECRFQMPDGNFKWLELTFYNLLHEPAVEAIILNYRDITESKIDEISLRTSEARLKQAEAIGHLGSWEMNWADKSIVWSDEMYRMVGADKKDVTPSLEASASFVHPDDRLAFFNRFEEISVSLEDGSLFHRIIRPDGEIRYVTMAWHFEFDDEGRPRCLFGILQDITQRKLTEMALEESEEKYRNLFQLSPSPMWVHDVETLGFLDVNEAAINHYGYSREEFMAMSLKEILSPEEHRKLEKLVQAWKEATIPYQDVLSHVKKTEEVIDVEIKSNPVNVGRRKARLVIATDISERMKYIQAIQHQNRTLREIAWTQSHVVRAPLARIMGLINLLEDYPATKADNPQILKLLSDSAHELDGIIRKIVFQSEQIDNLPIREEQGRK